MCAQLLLSLKAQVLMMFLIIQDMHIAFVAIAMENQDSHLCQLYLLSEKKNLISLNNGMNKIRRNNRS